MAEIPSAQQSANLLVANIHSIAASHMPVGISVGKIIAPPPDIQIAWNNILLEKEQVYIDQFLLPQYKRMIKGDTKLPNAEGNIRTDTQSRRGGHDKPSFVSHTHKIHNSYKADVSSDYEASAIYTDVGLAAGDYVSILPIENGQKFIVLGKLVYLPEFKLESEDGEMGDEGGNSFSPFF